MGGTGDDAAIRRAELWLERGRPHEAATALAPVLARDPHHPLAWVTMADIRLALEDAEGAVRAAEAALAAAPQWPYALTRLSAAWAMRGEHDVAVIAAERALAADPDEPMWHACLAERLLAAGAEPATAQRLAATAVAMAPDRAAFHVIHGVALFAGGRRRQAREALRTAVGLEPDNAAAQHFLAVVEGDRPGAAHLARSVRSYAAALRTDPTARDSRIGLDHTLRVFLVRTTGLAFGACFVTAQAARMGHLTLARLVAVAALLGPAWYAHRFVRGLDPMLRAYLRHVLTAGRLRRSAVALAAAYAGLPLVAFGPPSWRYPVSLGVIAAALVARLAAERDLSHHLRAHGVPVPPMLRTPLVVLAGLCAGALAVGLLALGAAHGNAAAVLLGAGPAALFGLCVVVVLRRRRPRRPG